MPRVKSIVVSEPEVENSGLRSYAIYKDVDGEENVRRGVIVVKRRYREFSLLQDCLRAVLFWGEYLTSPSVIVHPSRELLETRTVLLQRYLDNILAHRPLHTDPAFWLFIESESFPDMVREFQLVEKGPEYNPNTRVIRDNPRFPDALEGRLEYLTKITSRLEILKSALLEYFASQRNLANRITDIGKALTGYLDATIDCDRNVKLIHLIDSIDTISELLAVGTDQVVDAKSFTIIVDDYVRMMQEVQQTFALKRSWRAAVYSLEVQIIDTQASLIKSQNDQHRNFDKNYRLSESFLKLREELKEATAIYDTLCHKLNEELDRIDSQRMLEIEQCINRLLRNLLDAQTEIVAILEGFLLSANESAPSLTVGSEMGTMF